MSNYQIQKVSLTENSFFDKAVVGEKTFSSMSYQMPVSTSFNAGDLIPINHFEVLPNTIFEIDVDFTLRTETLKTPPFGDLILTMDAFLCYNYQVNVDFPAIFGENYAGAGVAEAVKLAPLWTPISQGSQSVKIKVGSVADYLFMPTQQDLNIDLLQESNDLICRHFCEVCNTYFRDQNLQAQFQYSKLNVYEGYLLDVGTLCPFGDTSDNLQGEYSVVPTSGGYADGAINRALFGDGGNPTETESANIFIPARKTSFSVNARPPKAPKFRDYFTSGLPYPQKGESVLVNFQGGSSVPVDFSFDDNKIWRATTPLRLLSTPEPLGTSTQRVAPLYRGVFRGSSDSYQRVLQGNPTNATLAPAGALIDGSNLVGTVDLSNSTIGVSINDLRLSAAIQQLYEALARGGTRYDEYLRTQFNLQINDKLCTRPLHIGRFVRRLDFFQTAQTSASVDGSTPQGNLSAFGYTKANGRFPRVRSYANGYVLFMLTVRHINRYPALYPKDKTRRSLPDFYQPQLANIGEQPIYTSEINPFVALINSQGNRQVFAYQEPWHEYRIKPAQASGLMRNGVPNSLSSWTIQDTFDPDLISIGDKWIESNTEEIFNRMLTVPSAYDSQGNATVHQFKGEFLFKVAQVLPMPTFSTPGMDII